MMWERDIRRFDVEMDVLEIKKQVDNLESVKFYELRSVVEDILYLF